MNAFIKSFSHLEKENQNQPDQLLIRFRQFMNGLKSYIINKRSSDFTQILEQMKEEYEYEENLTVEYVIESSIERALILPLKEKIDKYTVLKTKQSDKEFLSKVDLLKYKNQDYFGITEDFISQNCWVPAIKLISTLQDCVTPTEYLLCIFNTANEIFNEHKHQQKDKKKLIAGDEILPIFVYVVAKSSIKNPFQICEFIMQLGDPVELSRELGYYLTVFYSSCEAINQWKFE